MAAVTNQLSKSPVSSQDVRQASLNYLTCLLIQTAPHGEGRGKYDPLHPQNHHGDKTVWL